MWLQSKTIPQFSMHPRCLKRNRTTLPVDVDNDVQKDGSVDKQHDADGKVVPKKLVKTSIEKARPEMRIKGISNIDIVLIRLTSDQT